MMRFESPSEFFRPPAVVPASTPEAGMYADEAVDQLVLHSLARYVEKIAGGRYGDVEPATLADFIDEVLAIEELIPLHYGRSFNYPLVSGMGNNGNRSAADATLRSAAANLQHLTYEYSSNLFAADDNNRQSRAEIWRATLDDDFAVQIQGGSPASTLSLDISIIKDTDGHATPLCPSLSIDSEFDCDDTLGARLMDSEVDASRAGNEAGQLFHDRYGVRPDRLLGIVSLHAMRHMQPEYATAQVDVTSSSSSHAPDFKRLGFASSTTDSWLRIPDFMDGFDNAIDRAGLSRAESVLLDTAKASVNTAGHVTSADGMPGMTFYLRI